MDDLISRQSVSAWLDNMGYPRLADVVMDEKRFPPVQSEIIHCRECEYGAQDDEGWWYCIDYGCQVGDKDGSGFCAEGERRTNGSN